MDDFTSLCEMQMAPDISLNNDDNYPHFRLIQF